MQHNTTSKEAYLEKKILEVCCGDGNPFASKLISEKYFYKGIDISGFLINLAKKNYGDKYFDIGDAENLKFKKSMFELVFCIHSFWYISNINKTINEMTRVLKPKGYLIFDTLNSLNTQIRQNHEKVIFLETMRASSLLMEHLKLQRMPH